MPLAELSPPFFGSLSAVSAGVSLLDESSLDPVSDDEEVSESSEFPVWNRK